LVDIVQAGDKCSGQAQTDSFKKEFSDSTGDRRLTNATFPHCNIADMFAQRGAQKLYTTKSANREATEVKIGEI
jgi:hypothetical protein